MMPAALATAAKRCRKRRDRVALLNDLVAAVTALDEIRALEQGSGPPAGIGRAELRIRAAEEIGRCFAALLCLIRAREENVDACWERWVRAEAERLGRKDVIEILKPDGLFDDDGDGAVGRMMRVAVALAVSRARGNGVEPGGEAALRRGVGDLQALHRSGSRNAAHDKALMLIHEVALAAHLRGFGPLVLWMRASGRAVAGET